MKYSHPTLVFMHILTRTLTRKPMHHVWNTIVYQHSDQIYTKTYMYLETGHSKWKFYGEYALTVAQIWTSSLEIWHFAVAPLKHEDSSNQFKLSFVFCGEQHFYWTLQFNLIAIHSKIRAEIYEKNVVITYQIR